MSTPSVHSPGIVVHLLSLGRVHLLPGEVRPILQHRFVLALYLAVLLLLVGLDSVGASNQLPVELRAPIYMIGMTATILVVALALQGALRRSRRHGQVSLHLSPVLLIASLCGVLVGERLLAELVTPGQTPMVRLVLLFSFHYMVCELAVAIFAHGLLPSILGELRGLPIRKLVETDPALWQSGATTPAAKAAGTTTEAGFLVAGGRSFPLADLLHLQADGNYVHIRTTGQTVLLPGPLATLVRQIPADLGRQVHRSHWVAASALRGWSAVGREITLQLTNGQTVPVAITRRREVRDWLLSLGLREGRTG